MTYDNVLSLLVLLFISIGLYLMGCDHTVTGLWARSGTRKLAIRVLFKLRSYERRFNAFIGRPVQVLPLRAQTRRDRLATIRGAAAARPKR